MQITDTIADILTRIRNASSAKHATVERSGFQCQEGNHPDPSRRTATSRAFR